MTNCETTFSEKGSNKEKSERHILTFLQDFLRELKDAEKDDWTLTVTEVLQWISGQAHCPILPDEKKKKIKITVVFNHECSDLHGDHSVCYPVVSELNIIPRR